MPKLTKTMEILGYSPNKGGICYGVAMMASQAVIRDQSHHFLSRINFIKNASEEDIKSLNKPFDRIIPKAHLNIKVDLCSFFDELSIYHGNKSVNEEFRELVPDTQGADNVKNLAYAKKDNRYIYPEIKQNVINQFTYDEFFDFIIKIKNHLRDRSFSIILSHSQRNHATQIGFDAKQKKWLSIDHDYLTTGNDNVDDIKKVVNNIFIPHKYSYDGVNKLLVSMDIVLSEKNETDTEIDLTILKSDDFNIQQITTSFNRDALSHLIKCYEYASRYDEMIVIFDKIKELNLPEEENIKLLESKRNNGLTIFHVLVGRGKADVLKATLKKAKEMQLSLSSIIGILDKRDDEKLSSMLIFSLGYRYKKVAKVIKVLIDTINDIEDEDAKVKLLDAKNKDGFSALLMLAAHGHLEAIEVLINAINSIQNNQLKAKLLEAKDDDEGITALLAAAENGHAEVVKALLTAICHLKDQQLIAKLFEARDNYGVFSLLIAAEKGHKKVVEVLLAAIYDLKDQQLNIQMLEARNKYGVSALLMAIEKGHKEVVALLTTAICNIEDQKIRAKLLESKRKDGESALLMAVKKGNKEIAKILIDAIDSIEDKKTRFAMFEARSSRGLPALSTAIKNGNYQIARLLSSKLSSK